MFSQCCTQTNPILPVIILSLNSPETYALHIPIILCLLFSQYYMKSQLFLSCEERSTESPLKWTPHWQSQNSLLFCTNCTSTAGTHQEGIGSSTDICSMKLSDAVCTCTWNECNYTKFYVHLSFPTVFSDTYFKDQVGYLTMLPHSSLRDSLVSTVLWNTVIQTSRLTSLLLTLQKAPGTDDINTVLHLHLKSTVQFTASPCKGGRVNNTSLCQGHQSIKIWKNGQRNTYIMQSFCYFVSMPNKFV